MSDKSQIYEKTTEFEIDNEEKIKIDSQDQGLSPLDITESVSFDPTKPKRQRKSRAKAFIEAEIARKNRIVCCMCGGLLFENETDLLSHISSNHATDIDTNANRFYTSRKKLECKYCKQKFQHKKSLEQHKDDKEFKEKAIFRDRTRELEKQRNKTKEKLLRKLGINHSATDKTSVTPKSEIFEASESESQNTFTTKTSTVSKSRTLDPNKPKRIRKSRAKAIIEAEKAKKNRIVCCMCGGLLFENETDLLSHISSNHTTEIETNAKRFYSTRHKYECKNCKQKFRLQKSLESHLDDKDFKEERRDRAGEYESRKYKYKYKKNIENQSVVCTFCGLLSADKDQLKIHELRMHATEHPFECPHPQCGKRFAAKRLLRIHSFNHGARKHICNVNYETNVIIVCFILKEKFLF